MKLSPKSFKNIASALVPDVIRYIEEDSRYVDFMQEVIPDAIVNLMGELDQDLKFELYLAIMDKILLHKSTL